MGWLWVLVAVCSAAPGNVFVDPPERVHTSARVVGIGDLHGDLKATRSVLRGVGAIDDQDHWVGGDLVVVQTGDVLDRGDDEKEILDLLDQVATEAQAAGGALIPMLGNHELMNARGDFRYVTPGAASDWPDRAASFSPGGPEALRLASRDLIVVVNDTLFVHGGILPTHAAYGIDKINDEVAAWLRGDLAGPPAIMAERDSPQWSRHYSDDPDENDCHLLHQTLASLRLKRMVVGHTVQDVPNPACDGQVWRIDVGMSAHYGGAWGAVEIVGDEVRALGPASGPAAKTPGTSPGSTATEAN